MCPDRCADRLSCRTMLSCGAAAAGLPNTLGYGRGFGCRPRGTVRWTTRRIIPAQLVASVRLPVPSVQLGRVQPVSTLLVIGWSDALLARDATAGDWRGPPAQPRGRSDRRETRRSGLRFHSYHLGVCDQVRRYAFVWRRFKVEEFPDGPFL
jgi:hypothetical protein